MACKLAPESGSFHALRFALTQTVRMVPSSRKKALALLTRRSACCRTSVEGATARLLLCAGVAALGRISMGLASWSTVGTSEACRIRCVEVSRWVKEWVRF